MTNVHTVNYINVMNINLVNQALSAGTVDEPGLLPHIDQLSESRYVFGFDFGLPVLPSEPGLILVVGPRQYGKSTWLEQQIKKTIEEHGPGSAFYLNGDELRDARALSEAVRELLPLFARGSAIRRIFIDEITAIKDWVHALKRLIDSGELRKTLVIVTGSKAADLHHGSERLPGRKGRLPRTAYYFTPISYAEFIRVCKLKPGERSLHQYLITGGCPLACREIALHGTIPEFVIEMVRDWLYGECAASGRQRSSLMSALGCISKFGGTPVGQLKLAREAGLANNTVAAGYLELLSDLMVVASAHAWDLSRNIPIMRRPAKFHFINLLAATAWHDSHIRTADNFGKLSPSVAGQWYEWCVAQELWRRRTIRGEESPENLLYWKNDEHEIDFVEDDHTFTEVKHGAASPIEFSWFSKIFSKGHLTVINKNLFETDAVTGIKLEDFLLDTHKGHL